MMTESNIAYKDVTMVHTQYKLTEPEYVTLAEFFSILLG